MTETNELLGERKIEIPPITTEIQHQNSTHKLLKQPSTPISSRENIISPRNPTIPPFLKSNSQYHKLSKLDLLQDVYIQQPFRPSELTCECCFNWEVENLYQCYTSEFDASQNRSPMFSLKEYSCCCCRQLCGASSRPFTLIGLIGDGYDTSKTSIIFDIRRPYRCNGFSWACWPANWCCCGRNYLKVNLGGEYIGTVIEECRSCCGKLQYGVYNRDGKEICSLERSCIFCGWTDVPFHIYINGKYTGKRICKKYTNIAKEVLLTNTDYLIEFPQDIMRRDEKILLIAAAMLLEYKYFEKKDDKKNIGHIDGAQVVTGIIKDEIGNPK